ncbi:MAG: hypothetical protein KJO75_01055 [Dactylosporangium sp.]|nr:hypothetical protein [Dactylosporangium sp.]
MYVEPLALLMTQQMVRAEAESALPNAPVRDDRSRTGVAVERTRLRLATSLRVAAAYVEPPAVTGRPRTA